MLSARNSRPNIIDLESIYSENAPQSDNNQRAHRDKTTVAVASVVDQVSIGNIEEEDDENTDPDMENNGEAFKPSAGTVAVPDDNNGRYSPNPTPGILVCLGAI